MTYRRLIIVVAILAVLGALGWYAVSISSTQQNMQQATLAPTNTMLPSTAITIGTTKLQVELAETAAEQEQGLSGRTSLPEGHGMLFLFEQPGTVGFWMKDMNFSLDIIWADSNGVITTIDTDLSPNTYPQVFYPTAPAQYVLEVPAGFAKAHGIAIGMKIVLQ